jgi:hypothetical protein
VRVAFALLDKWRYDDRSVLILRSSLICIGALASCGCGSGDQTDPAPASNAQPFVQVEPTINVCPVFSDSLVIPLDIGPGVTAEIAVRASDPHGNDASLIYDWSAPSGTFSEPDRPVTAYRCAALGQQALQVRALDLRGCTGSLLIDVNCIDH